MKMWTKPWLWLPAQVAHDLAPWALRAYGTFFEKPTPVWNSKVWRGLVFKNPVGLAGGADKNADALTGWWSLGAGFVEVGTVTPLPQEANPGTIMARDMERQSLWNKMGFPSEGADEVLANLKALRPFRTPVFVNLGKNRATPNEEAANDYVELLRRFAGVADVAVINLSSPNTKGLRDLQSGPALRQLLEPISRTAREVNLPWLVKLSPDLSLEALHEALDVSLEAGVDGFVLTNTTLSRPEGSPYPVEGGLSGSPLKELSRKSLSEALAHLGPRREGKLIVSVGGIMDREEIQLRLKMGADLVQVYSALIFQGPGFFRSLSRSP